MPEVKTTYSSDTTITISPASLASSASLLAGRESTEIDNTTNLYIDAIVHGETATGTTTAGTNIYVYVWGNFETIGTNNLDVLDGTDSAETITDEGVRDSMLALGAIIDVEDTTARTFHIKPFSVAQLFGGVMPKFWGLFLVHDTGANLSATAGDHVFKYNGVTYTSA